MAISDKFQWFILVVIAKQSCICNFHYSVLLPNDKQNLADRLTPTYLAKEHIGLQHVSVEVVFQGAVNT